MYSEYLDKILEDQMEERFTRDFQKMKVRLSGLGIIFSIQYNRKLDLIIIYKLFVKDYQRNSGIGGRSMTLITNLADKYEKKITLTPSDIFGANLKRLIKFYRRFNFHRNPNPTLSGKYLRLPLDIL
jgi:hypothetical protein